MLTIPLRPPGRSALLVAPIWLGGNVFGWTVDEAMSHRLLDAWVDAGMNFVDTADGARDAMIDHASAPTTA